MKPYIVTMVYTNEKLFTVGTICLHGTTDVAGLGATHVLLDQHYPLKGDEVSEAIDSYRLVTPEAIVWDAGKNLGLHGGLNYIMERLEQVLRPDDIIIAFDCDESPERAGWADAMLRVFAADPKCGWLSLTTAPIDAELDRMQAPVIEVGGERVRIPEYNLMNVVCGWRVSAIRAAGVFTEPFAWYGGLEIAMQPKFREAGYWVGWMPEYKTFANHHLADATYQDFKRAHVGFTQPIFPGSFEEWIAAGNK